MAENIIPQINFQPWRQQKRQEAMQQFAVYAGLVILAAGFVVFILGSIADISVNAQKSRNAQINSEIKILEKRLSNIATLQKDRDDMLERMKIIQDLQGNRPISVRVFDELVRMLPETVFFESLSVVGNQMFVKGIAESNSEVSDLMRNIDRSDWFSSPNLTAIKAARQYGSYASEFELSFMISAAKSEEDQL